MTSKSQTGWDWNRIDCEVNPLNLSATLSSGQAFRWRRDVTGIWWGVAVQTIIAMWQRDSCPCSPLYWQTFPQPDQGCVVEGYLRLDVPLDSLYSDWIKADPRIGAAVHRYRGLRILRQPPNECFFGFQCATCNTVVKIERTVHCLAARYGVPLHLPPEGHAGPHDTRDEGPPPLSLPREIALPFHAFPELSSLAHADEAALRADLWGYRAPRVIELARCLKVRGTHWLEGLREHSYADAKSALVELHGVGEKVADCICLFCLDKDEAVPVDTHVRQIACQLFVPELQQKSLTPRVYAVIAGAYRDRFGPYAGWAQQYLFLGALRGSDDRF